MATELVRWCDVCLSAEDEARTPGAATSLSLDGQAHELDLCPAHRAELEQALTAFLDSARKVKPATTAPAPAPSSMTCPECGHSVGTRSGLRHHFTRSHPELSLSMITGADRPAMTCPDCGHVAYGGTGLAAHRRAKHGRTVEKVQKAS